MKNYYFAKLASLLLNEDNAISGSNVFINQPVRACQKVKIHKGGLMVQFGEIQLTASFFQDFLISDRRWMI